MWENFVSSFSHRIRLDYALVKILALNDLLLRRHPELILRLFSLLFLREKEDLLSAFWGFLDPNVRTTDQSSFENENAEHSGGGICHGKNRTASGNRGHRVCQGPKV